MRNTHDSDVSSFLMPNFAVHVGGDFLQRTAKLA